MILDVLILDVPARCEWGWICLRYAELLQQTDSGGGVTLGGVCKRPTSTAGLDLLYTVLSFLPHSPQVLSYHI